MKKFSLNGIEMGSKMTLRFVCFLAAAMHLTFLLFFRQFKVTPLMFFNIGSVTFYLLSGFLLLRKSELKHYLMWITAIFTEIVVHAALCTLLLGVDTCFVLYPITVLPICAYFLFLHRNGQKKFLRLVVIFVCATFCVTAVTVAVAEYFGGYVPTNIAVLSRKEKMIIRTVNIFFAAIILYGFTMMFYLEMTRLLENLRESSEKLKYTATHDALTGLTNRRSFWDYFDTLSHDCKHYNIALGDLDSFKKINDTYGHGCGDLVLKSVADIINNSTNENEIACRWGGEEMVVVFIGERSDALVRLEEIRKKIETLSLNYEGLNVHVTMTFGFADSEEIKRAMTECEENDNNDPSSKRYGMESLISMADKRLYMGKGNGKNVVVDK